MCYVRLTGALTVTLSSCVRLTGALTATLSSCVRLTGALTATLSSCVRLTGALTHAVLYTPWALTGTVHVMIVLQYTQ